MDIVFQPQFKYCAAYCLIRKILMPKSNRFRLCVFNKLLQAISKWINLTDLGKRKCCTDEFVCWIPDIPLEGDNSAIDAGPLRHKKHCKLTSQTTRPNLKKKHMHSKNFQYRLIGSNKTRIFIIDSNRFRPLGHH